MLSFKETGVAGSFPGRGVTPAVGRGAAHSNTQEERDKSRDSFLNYRESTEGKGDKCETGETEDVTWGLRDAQDLL